MQRRENDSVRSPVWFVSERRPLVAVSLVTLGAPNSAAGLIKLLMDFGALQPGVLPVRSGLALLSADLALLASEPGGFAPR